MAIKCLFMLRRQPHLSHEEFIDYWRNKHAQLSIRYGDVVATQRYVQLHPLDDSRFDALAASRGSPVADYDGIVEVWWESFEALTSLAESAEEVAQIILDDEKRFIDLSRSEMYFSEEHFIIGKPTELKAAE